jgi:hypothetical protein
MPLASSLGASTNTRLVVDLAMHVLTHRIGTPLGKMAQRILIDVDIGFHAV